MAALDADRYPGESRRSHTPGPRLSPASTRSIDQLDPKAWNALAGSEVPFLRHEFLAALEHTGCVGPASGWTPSYITLHDDGRAGGGGAGLPQGPFLRRVRLRLLLGRGLRAVGPQLLPEADGVPCRSRRRPERGCCCARMWIGRSVRRRLAQAIEEFAPAPSTCPRPMPCSSMRRTARRWRRPAGCCAGTASFTGPTRATATSSSTSRPSRPRSARRRAASGAGCRKPGIHFETRFGTDIGASAARYGLRLPPRYLPAPRP